jgi:hypothetical protein
MQQTGRLAALAFPAVHSRKHGDVRLKWRCEPNSLRCCRLRPDFGVEEAVKVDGLSKADISKQLEALVKKGEGMPRSTESEGKL